MRHRRKPYRALEARVGTMERLDEPAASLELVTAFDVICQAERDATEHIFRSIGGALVRGGLFALRESAMDIAAGAHDRAVGIRHRFTKPQLHQSLIAAGFEPLRVTYVNT